LQGMTVAEVEGGQVAVIGTLKRIEALLRAAK
jgi:hypothetical protein